MKTYVAKPNAVARKWYVVDASGKPLGRLASEIAKILRGKHKPHISPPCDTGDFVIVVNAEKVQLTGKKLDQKMYRRHSQYPGGFKETPYRELIARKPDFVIYKAVKGMLPKNRLGRKMLKKLRVYAGPTHKHQAQKPERLEL